VLFFYNSCIVAEIKRLPQAEELHMRFFRYDTLLY